MVTTSLIDYQYTFMSWSVMCFDLLLMNYKWVESNRTYSSNSLE
jgi:hypothetical protein